MSGLITIMARFKRIQFLTGKKPISILSHKNILRWTFHLLFHCNCTQFLCGLKASFNLRNYLNYVASANGTATIIIYIMLSLWSFKGRHAVYAVRDARFYFCCKEVLTMDFGSPDVVLKMTIKQQDSFFKINFQFQMDLFIFFSCSCSICVLTGHRGNVWCAAEAGLLVRLSRIHRCEGQRGAENLLCVYRHEQAAGHGAELRPGHHRQQTLIH